MIIAVEFDGTIVEDEYPKIGKERPFAFYILKELQNRGNEIILWTCRTGKDLDSAIQYCQNNGLIFNAINSDINASRKEIQTNSAAKVNADTYIDFHNICGIPSWNEIFWQLYPNELRTIKFKHPVKQQKNFFKRMVNKCI